MEQDDIVLSEQDEDFLDDIKDLSEEKKNSIIAYVKDKVEATKESIGVFVEEITVSPDMLFTGKVVKSGNGASISFKKKFVGREVYIIVKE